MPPPSSAPDRPGLRPLGREPVEAAMSEPVQLVRLGDAREGRYAVFVGNEQIGQISEYIKPWRQVEFIWTRKGFVGQRGHCDTRNAAAVALAKACGIPNPIPPKEWP